MNYFYGYLGALSAAVGMLVHYEYYGLASVTFCHLLVSICAKLDSSIRGGKW